MSEDEKCDVTSRIMLERFRRDMLRYINGESNDNEYNPYEKE